MFELMGFVVFFYFYDLCGSHCVIGCQVLEFDKVDNLVNFIGKSFELCENYSWKLKFLIRHKNYEPKAHENYHVLNI